MQKYAAARITVTGKNQLERKRSPLFQDSAKEYCCIGGWDIASEPLVIVKTARLRQYLYYNGQMLKANKDFTMSDADRNKKWTSGDNDKR